MTLSKISFVKQSFLVLGFIVSASSMAQAFEYCPMMACPRLEATSDISCAIDGKCETGCKVIQPIIEKSGCPSTCAFVRCEIVKPSPIIKPITPIQPIGRPITQ